MFITLNEFKEQYFEQLAEEHGEKRALIETEKLTQDDWIDLADQGQINPEIEVIKSIVRTELKRLTNQGDMTNEEIN